MAEGGGFGGLGGIIGAAIALNIVEQHLGTPKQKRRAKKGRHHIHTIFDYKR